MSFLDTRLPPDFWDRCVPEPMSGCWLWIGSWNLRGYGQLSTKERPRKGPYLAHRFAYEKLVGPIPDGLVLDHRVCATPCCVNPAHLDPCTRGDNTRRWASTITHCKHGHAYDEANTYVPREPGLGRKCRRCRADGMKRKAA